MSRTLLHLTCAVLVVGSLSGCATKKFVRTEVDTKTEPTNQRVGEIETQVESTQSEIAKTNKRVDEQAQAVQRTSKTAQDALDRANAAGKLAEGSLVSETVFSNDTVRFKINTSELTDEAKAALDEFAAPLIADNKGIYIEIQGHTDSSGPDAVNYELGLRRAEAVRRHLSQAHAFPLHRMSVISYGEAAPAYDNKTLDGRRANRRVVLVVLK